jgi:ribosome-associated protein
MSRKPTKGYYVKGQFVAEGSELDLELKRELRGDVDVSRTDLKRESTELQKLGEALLTLRADLRNRLDLPDKLLDALTELQRITNFEGRRRQAQFVGKLMRQLPPATLEAARAALAEQHLPSAQETALLHTAEQWRDQLIADDAALARWMNDFPDTDSQQLRALVRQARKDTVPADKTAVSQGKAPRQGRAYRDLFQLLRAQLAGAVDESDPSLDEAHDDE